MRLIQVASNPLLLQNLNMPMKYLKEYLQARSPKIDYAIDKALELKENGEKTLIWTNFVDNVRQVVTLCEAKGLTQFIDGSVKDC